MSTRQYVQPNGVLASCVECHQGIWHGSQYYTVSKGFLDDLVTAIDVAGNQWHTHCLDPYILLVDLAPEESISITLHHS